MIPRLKRRRADALKACGRQRATRQEIALILVGLALAGCGIARINHLHSDSNQKQIDKAVEAFQQTTSDRAGLGPTLLKNLDALTTLRRTVTDTRSKLDDVDRATALADSTWLDLRQQLLAAFGLFKLPDDAEKASPTLALIIQRDAVRQGNQKLAERIRTRVERIDAVIKVVEALILGDRAQAAQAKENVAKLTQAKKKDDVPKTGETSKAATPLSPIDLLVTFQRAVSDAGRQAAKDTDVRTAASALEKALRDRAAQSREPAAAYALVALVGTGLGKDDFRGLDAFLNYLDERLAAFLNDVLRVAGPLSQEWEDFVEAAKRARELTALGIMRARETEPAVQVAAHQASARRVQTFLRTFGEGKDIANIVALIDEERSKFRRSENINAAALSTPDGDGTRTPIDRLLTVVDGLATQVDGLRDVLEAFPISLESLTALFGPSSGAAQSDASLAGAGFTLLEKALASDPKLLARLDGAVKNGVVKQDDLKQIGAIAADIGSQRDAAAVRVADYLKSLRQIQLDLHEENLRHDQAVVAIAAQEIKRWKLILAIDAESNVVFTDLPACKKNEPEAQPGIVLFATQQRVDCWTEWHTLPPRTMPRDGVHAVISDSDRILPSIRKLAETARVWQRSSPNTNDPRGLDTNLSNQRLWVAVKLVNAHLLLLSVNQRLAFDNRIRLSHEIGEHELHLDGIAARAEEAGLTLALGDVAAFHAAGITQTDLQAFFGIIQSALLAYIGGRI